MCTAYSDYSGIAISAIFAIFICGANAKLSSGSDFSVLRTQKSLLRLPVMPVMLSLARLRSLRNSGWLKSTRSKYEFESTWHCHRGRAGGVLQESCPLGCAKTANARELRQEGQHAHKCLSQVQMFLRPLLK
eukprot:s1531_g5.t1